MIATEVLRQGPQEFTDWGESRGCLLHLTEETIEQKLASDLLAYAECEVKLAGMEALLDGWKVVIGTSDAHEPPAIRSYYVTWSNPQGTEITLDGILVKKNLKPYLDHKFSIQQT